MVTPAKFVFFKVFYKFPKTINFFCNPENVTYMKRKSEPDKNVTKPMSIFDHVQESCVCEDLRCQPTSNVCDVAKFRKFWHFI